MAPDFSTGNFSKLFYLSAQPMWIFEPGSLRFLEVNEAASWEYGYKKADFKLMTLLDIRPPEEHANFRQALGELAGDQLLIEPFRHLRESIVNMKKGVFPKCAGWLTCWRRGNR
jgi:hypothetical protein